MGLAEPRALQTISGNSLSVVAWSRDDHAVKEIKLYMNGQYMSTSACDNISYQCELSYNWRLGAPGLHEATFKATDWTGNVAVETVTLTVG